MSKISSILLGIVFVSIIAGTFGIFMNSLQPNNTAEFDDFMVNDKVQTEMDNLRTDLERMSSGSLGAFDIIGLLFSSAYSSAKLLFFNSISLVTSIVFAVFGHINIDSSMATLFIGGITTMILIIIIARVILSTIFKRET